ncbi:MAG: aspartate/glutamate/glutamine transport system permease protein [Chloroflexota bacterium]|nr:aspartate/glutamate/glutamine transport system permease protein [Chloroflexota bacterium]
MDLTLLWLGLLETLKLSILSILISLVLGTVIGIMRAAPLRPVAVFAEGYVVFFRNIPLLIILFFILNGLPASPLAIRLGFFETGLVGLAVYTAAYVAEVVRAGLESLSRGQLEAARSLGMSWALTMRYVLLPQAFAAIIPPLGSVFVALTKNTALASTVAVPELLYQSKIVEARTFNPNVLLITGLMYLIITIPLGVLVNHLEARFSVARFGQR